MPTTRKAPRPTPADREIEDAWRTERPYLLSMATGMLHTHSAAEDVVQEAFGRLARIGIAEIHDVRGWLMVVVRRLCLDEMNSAHARRDSTPGWLNEGDRPLAGERPTDPGDQITLDDEVRLALALVLDRLTPAERTAFVLHDVFGFPFESVGDLVGRTPAACRQLASRARASIRTGEPPAHSDLEVTHQRALAERFIAACAGGDITQLMVVLDPDVAGEATLDGHGPLARTEGREAVAHRVLELFGPDTGRLLIPIMIERSAGVVALDHGRVIATFRLDERQGLIHHLKASVRRPGPRDHR